MKCAISSMHSMLKLVIYLLFKKDFEWTSSKDTERIVSSYYSVLLQAIERNDWLNAELKS